MGLFEKRDISNEQPLYTLGEQKTLLIVGLGNIGREYQETRHNIGFEVLEFFAKKQAFGGWVEKKDLKCQQASRVIGDNKIILCRPMTFMNDSGKAVQAVQHYYRVTNSQTLVIHDELDIDFGQIRTRVGGGAAGHNGIKSIIEHCGEDFGRVRIGIGPKRPAQIDSSDYVLGRFSKTQEKDLPLFLQETTALLSEYCFSSELPNETRRFII